jgi:hypothetical protein
MSYQPQPKTEYKNNGKIYTILTAPDSLELYTPENKYIGWVSQWGNTWEARNKFGTTQGMGFRTEFDAFDCLIAAHERVTKGEVA